MGRLSLPAEPTPPHSPPPRPGTALCAPALLGLRPPQGVPPVVVSYQHPHPHVCFLPVVGHSVGLASPCISTCDCGCRVAMPAAVHAQARHAPTSAHRAGTQQVVLGYLSPDPVWPGGSTQEDSLRVTPALRGSALTAALPRSWTPRPHGQRDVQQGDRQTGSWWPAEATENWRKLGRAAGGWPDGSWKSSLPVFPTKGLCPPRKATGQQQRTRLFRKQGCFPSLLLAQ